MKKILFIFGTRPEAIKMAPVIKELKKRNSKFKVWVCVTGQHREMLDQVLDFFSIKPDYDLSIMKAGQSLFGITTSILEKIEPIIDQCKPDIILVQGDTTSAFVGGLSGYYKQIKVGHIEAGLRSGDIYSPFPEEMNRKLVGCIAEYNFAPTQRAVDSLLAEGISKKKVYKVGNTVIDALIEGLEIVKNSSNKSAGLHLENIDWTKRIILVTGHRRESFGKGFENICMAIKRIAINNPEVTIIYPVHLNPNVQEPVNRILKDCNNILLIQPLEYPDLLWIMEKSFIVLTDSGGIQEEAPSLGKPVLVMREVTERVEGIEAGTAKLVGTDVDMICNEVQKLLDSNNLYTRMATATNPYGDGTTAVQIADILER